MTDSAPQPRAVAGAESLSMLLTVVSSAGDERGCARLLASGLSSLVPTRLCWIALRDATTGGWDVVDQDGKAPASEPMGDEWAELNTLRETIEGRGSSLLGGEEAVSRIPSLLDERGVERVTAVPIQTLRQQLGLLLVERSDGEDFTLEEVNLVQTLAQHLAVAIENFRLAASLEEANQGLKGLVDERTKQLRFSEQRQRALLDVNNAIVANLNREALFTAVADSMVDVSPFDRANFYLHEPERDLLTVYALAGSPAGGSAPAGTTFPHQGTHLDEVLETRRALIRGDLRDGASRPIEKELLRMGFRAYVSIPLLSKSRVLGALNLASRSADQYSEADAAFLLEVGKQVALAIENMLAYERIDELKRQLALENEYLREEDSSARGFGEIIGESSAIRHALEQAKLVAPTDASVILLGESGTGKELLARAVHQMSDRADGPLIRVNCAAIPNELFESEFFGHAEGAFTGAHRDRVGRFELADGGTLFLDEVGEIPLDLQGKLLRVLQEGTFERVGEGSTRQVDVRVVTATNRDLPREIGAGRFRQDLYYRLSVFPIELPPLRDRCEDIPPLARHFLQSVSTRLGRRALIISEQSLDRLCKYDWPGNIRELQNVIERAVITSRAGVLRIEELRGSEGSPRDRRGEEVRRPDDAVLTYDDLREMERENIKRALTKSGWRVSGAGGAAELLGLRPTTLNSKLKALRLSRRPR